MPLAAEQEKQEVREFWERTPCGSTHADAPMGSAEFFRQVEAARARLEPFIADYAGFAETREQSVLEVGVGLGTDFMGFVRAGAIATGVDLTEAAVAQVKRRLELEGLTATVETADAESLPFESNTFDVAYSWGVLHHTPNTPRAIEEIQRVLRPGGRACVMLYARYSWVAFGVWVRHALLRGRPWRSLSAVLSDHMESTGTKAYTKRELEDLFSGFDNLSIEHVGTPYDRRVAGAVAGLTGRRLGWFMVIRATGPT